MTTLVIATRNAHKVQEIRHILGDDFRCLALPDCPGAPEVIEDAATFEGNARKKVLSLAQWLEAPARREPRPTIEATQSGTLGRARLRPSLLLGKGIEPQNPWYILADDSGLEVDALAGAPGIRSARFAADDVSVAGNAPDAANNAKLLRLLAGQPAASRTARFRCVLAVLPLGLAEAQTLFFEGVCEGIISDKPAGANGFGYDPLFVPLGYTQSFAELGDETKNQLSHRARALEKLNAWIKK